MIVIARYDSDSIAALQLDSSDDKPVHKRVHGGSTLQNGYFVAMGFGTFSGCPLEIHRSYFSESCSEARYDLLGRSLKKQHYPNLKIPQYTFNHDFSVLTIE